MVEFVVICVACGAVIIGILINSAMEKRRRADWAAIAPGLGLRYCGQRPLDDTLKSLKAFSLGRSRKLTNVLVGESGRIRVLLGDYRYTTGSGKSSTTHRHTVCILERDGLDLPHCYLRPQNILDALGKLFGGQDIDFEDDPAFSQAFVLQGPNVAAIRRRLDRSSRAWLAAHAGTLERFEARDGMIAFLAPKMEPSRAPRLLDDALNFPMLWSNASQEGGARLDL